MIKPLWAAVALSVALLSTTNVMAQKIGIVDLKKIFESSPRVKKINEDLSKQYAPERDKLVAQQKTLQDNLTKLQRDQATMDQKSIEQLRNTIVSEDRDLRTQQAQLQQTLVAAQNKAMSDFVALVSSAAKKVADDKKIDLVLPQNSVLYAKDSVDLTLDVAHEVK